MSVSPSPSPRPQRLCLVGTVVDDPESLAAAQTIGVPVITSETGAEIISDTNWYTYFVMNVFDGPIFKAIQKTKHRFVNHFCFHIYYTYARIRVHIVIRLFSWFCTDEPIYKYYNEIWICVLYLQTINSFTKPCIKLTKPFVECTNKKIKADCRMHKHVVTTYEHIRI